MDFLLTDSDLHILGNKLSSETEKGYIYFPDGVRNLSN